MCLDGREASAFTKRMVEGKEVYLEYEQGSPAKDRYGRTLDYIYLKDSTLLNREIIEQGVRTRLHAVPVLEDGGVPGGTTRGTSCSAWPVKWRGTRTSHSPTASESSVPAFSPEPVHSSLAVL